MKNATKKQKGSKFEQFVVDTLNDTIDPKARRTRASGAGYDKGDIYSPGLNWVIECKNHKHLSIINWIEQSERENVGGHNLPVLMFKSPKSPDVAPEAYCVVSLADFIDIVSQRAKISVEAKSDNRQLIWKVEKLVTSAKEVIKELKI